MQKTLEAVDSIIMEVNKIEPTSNMVENVDGDQTEPRHHDLVRNTDDDAASIRSEALGDNLPDGYFWSAKFIGCITVSISR